MGSLLSCRVLFYNYKLPHTEDALLTNIYLKLQMKGVYK